MQILQQAMINICLKSIFCSGIGNWTWLSSFWQTLVSYFCVVGLRLNYCMLEESVSSLETLFHNFFKKWPVSSKFSLHNWKHLFKLLFTPFDAWISKPCSTTDGFSVVKFLWTKITFWLAKFVAWTFKFRKMSNF